MKYILLSLLLSITTMAGLPPTSLKSQLGTKTTTFNFEVPNYQATKTSTGGLIETGNNNVLSNAGFEHTTVATDWTITNGTGSSTTSTPFGSKAITITASAQQSILASNTGSGAAQAGLQCLVSAYVKTSLSNVLVCAIQNGVFDSNLCVSVNSTNSWQEYQVPVACDATSTVAQIRMSSSGTGSFDVDNVFVGAKPLGNVATCSGGTACRASLIARINGTTASIISQAETWVSSVTRNSAGDYNINFVSGVFTVAPTCQVTNSFNGNFSVDSPTITTSSVLVRNYAAATGVVTDSASLTVECFKLGVDYTNAVATSPAVNTINADYDWTPYTPTFQGFGTPTGVEFFHKRQGSDLLVRGSFIPSSTSGVQARISLPSGLTSSSTINSGAVEIGGRVIFANAASGNKDTFILNPASQTYVQFGFTQQDGSSGIAMAPANDNGFATGGVEMTLSFRIPIQGWVNNNVIIGSFQGVYSNGATANLRDLRSYISAGGVPSESGSSDWISGNCSIPATGRFQCTLNAGAFTTIEGCVCSAQDNTSPAMCQIWGAPSTLTVTTQIYDHTGTPQNFQRNILCWGTK
jgi:hypothetical protein